MRAATSASMTPRSTGGAAGHRYAIGERLARLSERSQLLVVTHSPQVAARGQTHYLIAKSSEGTVPRTGVVLLDEMGRIAFASPCLSG